MTLVARGPDVVLTVTDNGHGLVRKAIGRRDALGIVGMRERAIALDGTLTLTGPIGRGTTVTVRVPLSRVLVGRIARTLRRGSV
jgi:signal transduction histidine kinase